MTSRETAILAFKLFGIYLFASQASVIRDFVFFFSAETPKLNLVRSLAVGVAVVLAPVLGLIFWKYADPLARRTIRTFDSPEREATHDSDIRAIAFSIMGMFLVTQVIVPISREVFVLATYDAKIDQIPFSDYLSNRLALPALGPPLIQLIIGVWLLFGSMGLSGMIRRFRAAGMNVPEEPT